MKYSGQNASEDGVKREHDKNLEYLNDASERIQELEVKLQTLEARIPKTYPEVKFLNYLNRKRILVCFSVQGIFSSKRETYFSVNLGDGGCRFCWFAFGGSFDAGRS